MSALQVTAELECSCGHVWDAEACEHMGALDIYEPECPECGEGEPQVLEVAR